MRTKETADDYRLFPDPDLAPFDLSDEFIEEARERIPELPDARREHRLYELSNRPSEIGRPERRLIEDRKSVV